ncbi:MAG: exodeoxyribonuclease III [Puniceicoccales bacterium]|jgi:exodeoxyribonuclease-3|nr:exodeoxyribonuclease III [Puniceicoccales bacterium]
MSDATNRTLSLFSWNVNGYRSIIAKTFHSFLEEHSPDILCLQEIKMNMSFNGDFTLPYPYQIFHPAEKSGYSGTAILSRVKPLSVSSDFAGEHPREGRVICAEFTNCYVVCAYVPNARHGLTRLDYRLSWDTDFREHLTQLATKKPIFVCADFNCAHTEIDLENPAQNRHSAGFSDEERASFTRLLESGFHDTFREKNPDAIKQYTWWSYRMRARERNIGWRIDYWLASTSLSNAWHSPQIHPNIAGSDHCPVSIAADALLFV